MTIKDWITGIVFLALKGVSQLLVVAGCAVGLWGWLAHDDGKMYGGTVVAAVLFLYTRKWFK